MTSDNYAKLFHSILTSSIWSEDDKTRIMWVTILALSDRDGYVTATIPGLAAMARMTVADAERAVGKLMQPDQYSRTADHEGRRIEVADGGWYVLNYAKYREIGTIEARKTKAAERQARFRERRKAVTDSNAIVTHECENVTKSNASPILIPISIPIDGVQEGGCKGEAKPTKAKKELAQPCFESQAFLKAWEDWQEHRREIKKPLTPKASDEQMKEFRAWGEARAITAIRHTIRKGWQGIREPDQAAQPANQRQNEVPCYRK
jgi:hypothetical protein